MTGASAGPARELPLFSLAALGSGAALLAAIFLNLRLSARLGAAFGFLVLALVASAAVALSGLGKVERSAERLSDHDVAALGDLVTVSEDFLASGWRSRSSASPSSP